MSSEGLARGAGELSCAELDFTVSSPLRLRLLHLRSGWRRRCPLFSVRPAHYGFEPLPRIREIILVR